MEACSYRPSSMPPGSTNSSLCKTRLVTRETNRKSLEMAQTFTTDLVRRTIKSCRNSKAFGPDKLSIFHLKHLRPRAIQYITALFNLSVTTCQIPATWKSSLIIPIPKPGKDTSVSAYLTSLSSRESTGVWAADDNRYHNGNQPEEAPDPTICVAVDLVLLIVLLFCYVYST